MEAIAQIHAPAALHQWKETPTHTHWIGGWAGPRASLETAVTGREKMDENRGKILIITLGKRGKEGRKEGRKEN